jgi:hypothetical protein
MLRRHRPLILTAIVSIAAFSLLAAGCGSSSSRVASLTTTSTVAATTPQDGLVAYSHCMRSNGVENFPDPQRVDGRTLKLTIQRLLTSNPRFRTAQSACDHLLPNGGSTSLETVQQQRARLAAELSFARCMRGHGLNRFPDPTAQGQLTVEMVRAQGIDIHSPRVLRIVSACLPASRGWLTPAKVREALHNAGG